jgi:hypothetical protein
MTPTTVVIDTAQWGQWSHNERQRATWELVLEFYSTGRRV